MPNVPEWKFVCNIFLFEVQKCVHERLMCVTLHSKWKFRACLEFVIKSFKFISKF
jgi:hypothetical protein